MFLSSCMVELVVGGVGASVEVERVVEDIAEHSDSMIVYGTSTAAWPNLATPRSPTSRQASVEGFHDKIEVR